MAGGLDHYRADGDTPVDPGVYRVVVRVDRGDLPALAPADDPDAGWGRLRQAPGRLTERPLYATLGVGLVAYGGYQFAALGDRGGLLAAAGGLAVLWLLVR